MMSHQSDYLNPSTKTLVWISGIVGFLFTANQGSESQAGYTNLTGDGGPSDSTSSATSSSPPLSSL